MISAKEALENSNSVNTEACKDQISTINDLISRATNLGETKVYTNFFLFQPVRAEMEKLGYEIESGSHRNEQHTTISWGT